jgi:hypothetical protein
MKKKTIIIESVILVTSIILLVLFLGLPQMLDLNKRANQQKNISQLTELSLATNKFLDKYMFSMTSDLSRIKEKMEYTQRLNVPGDSKFQYFIYGGIKDADLRYVVSYDLFDLMNQYNKITDSNKQTFINSVNAYVISAKSRMINSPEREKYVNYVGYLDLLLSKLDDDNYFKRAQYTNTIVNPKFDSDKVSTFRAIAQNFAGSELFKERRQPISIIFYLCYINQVDYEKATAETFDNFYRNFGNMLNFNNYYANSAGNPLEDGMKSNDVKEMFNKEFHKFYLASIHYNDRLNKGIVAIGTNATVDPTNRLTNEFLNELVGTSYQQEVNQAIDDLLAQYPGDYDGFARALRTKIDSYKMRDVDRQIVDIYESIFNYMQYQEYLYKSIDKQKDNFVATDFNNKFKDFFHSYILKYDKTQVLGDLANLIDNERKSNEKNLLSRFENNNLLKDFRSEMKKQTPFLTAFYRSKSYSDIIKKSKKQFIDGKTTTFANRVKEDKLTIDNLKKNISNDRIIEDAEYQNELKSNVALWENQFAYVQYLVSKDNPNSSQANISQEMLADSTIVQKENKNVIDKLNAGINEAKENYIKNDYTKYKSLFSYVDYCAKEIVSTIKTQRATEFDQYRDAIIKITSEFIDEKEYPEFENELVSKIRTELNDLHKTHSLQIETLSPEYVEKLDALNAKLTNHEEYRKFSKANRVANNRILSEEDIEAFKNVSINPNGLINYYNFYLYYTKDKIDKTRFYSSFSKSQLQLAQKRYIDNKIASTDTDWSELENQIKTLVASNNQDDRAQFTSTMKLALKNYREFRNDTYKYKNAFNFNGLLSDLARSENNIKFYRGQIEFPFYDKDEFYLIYGRFIEQGNKKLGISLVTYTDIHNFPKANAVVVRNLGSTNEDVDAIAGNLQTKLNDLITKYQQEIVKLSQEKEEFKNINVIHNNDPDYKITTQAVQAKKIIRERFTGALEQMIEEFVRETY